MCMISCCLDHLGFEVRSFTSNDAVGTEGDGFLRSGPGFDASRPSVAEGGEHGVETLGQLKLVIGVIQNGKWGSAQTRTNVGIFAEAQRLSGDEA